jgi:hypothetical protein
MNTRLFVGGVALVVGMICLSGCDPLEAGTGKPLDTGPGTTINSGKSQCRYKIIEIRGACVNLQGEELCIEECTTTSECNSGGPMFQMKADGFEGSAGKTCDGVVLELLKCEVCATSTSDGWRP